MTNKKNYRTLPPPENVSKQLVDIANTVIGMPGLSADGMPGLSAEIKGWWIWVHGKPSISQEALLTDMSFFCSKSGKNAGKWYYKHPMAPNVRRGIGYKPKPKPASKPKPLTQLTERDKLEEELAGFEKMYQVDSGENHININKMIADVKVKLDALETHKPMPLQEFIDEQTDAIEQETEAANNKEVSTEEKPAPTAAQLRDFFKK